MLLREVNKVRLDKWLWSVRVFKSRSMATDACKSGKVKLASQTAKASSMVSEGQVVEVKKNGFNLTFRVIRLIEKRVSASLASTCIEDLTPSEELTKYKDWFTGKAAPEFRDRGDGRPTKKERREIDEFKVVYLDDEDGWEEDE